MWCVHGVCGVCVYIHGVYVCMVFVWCVGVYMVCVCTWCVCTWYVHGVCICSVYVYVVCMCVCMVCVCAWCVFLVLVRVYMGCVCIWCAWCLCEPCISSPSTPHVHPSLSGGKGLRVLWEPRIWALARPLWTPSPLAAPHAGVPAPS